MGNRPAERYSLVKITLSGLYFSKVLACVALRHLAPCTVPAIHNPRERMSGASTGSEGGTGGAGGAGDPANNSSTAPPSAPLPPPPTHFHTRPHTHPHPHRRDGGFHPHGGHHEADTPNLCGRGRISARADDHTGAEVRLPRDLHRCQSSIFGGGQQGDTERQHNIGVAEYGLC
jgi:hypothetical protein